MAMAMAMATTAMGDARMPMPSTTFDRRVAAFVGGLVADAAAMPLHWIYDTNEIASIDTIPHARTHARNNQPHTRIIQFNPHRHYAA